MVETMIWVYAGVLGACLGSFLNVIIYRLPLDKSIVRPGSSCPSCGEAIRWYDNIPLISYAVLRGRCRRCKAGISLRYPVIEACSAAIALLDYRLYGLSWQAMVVLVLCLGMLAVAIIDFEHMIIPNELSLGGIAVGLGFSFIHGGIIPSDQSLGVITASMGFSFLPVDSRPLDALIGAYGGAFFLWFIRWGHMKISGIEGMGMGDVKLAGTIGAFVGWYALPLVLTVSAASGLVMGGLYILISRKGSRTPIPFGTFLALGTMVYSMGGPVWSQLINGLLAGLIK